MSNPGQTKIPAFYLEEGTTPEKIVRYNYDVRNDKWTQSSGKVLLNGQPFGEGSMRAAFFMEDPSKATGENRFVAKMSKNPKEQKSTYFMDVEMQALAKLFAEEFNKFKPPKKVDFIVASVIRCLERRGEPLLGVEPLMTGNFEKHSNNYGFVSYDDRNTPQAFSHFTYCHSQGRLLICDIQGVTMSDGDRYTDPQIHSRNGKGFGKGNLGYEGMKKFFATHRCNSICKFLNLPAVNPKANDRGTTPCIESSMKRLSINRTDDGGVIEDAESADPEHHQPPSPRQFQPANPPKDDEALDPKMLGLSPEQFIDIKKKFSQACKEGTDRIGKRGLILLAGELGYKMTMEQAVELMKKLDFMDVGTLDMRQFLWWWCGIEE
eukprot:TRINITY_DN104908_c0_g1_i1.p1 TRINITY_DN104908_c0_g1~~TRINITY_DN104908_c0_g1_i1.p1  ORF type:complete len:378 (-),score=45.67 TRINITY_DN104908_c0_g1_i1:151-1284(-)